jgi:hypothetical protein
MERRGIVVRFLAGTGYFFLFDSVCRLWALTASCLMGTGDLYLGVKRPERESYHSHPSIVQFNTDWG